SFTMVSGVKTYGGFSGDESELSQRDTSKLTTINETILDGGDINYHVIYNNIALSGTTLLDGFTIKGGKASDGTRYAANTTGGGIYNGASVQAEFRNLLIRNNWSIGGGAVYNLGPASFTNILIKENTVKYDGGGIHNSSAGAVFTDIVVSGNTANRSGGGIYTAAAAAFTNVVFNDNTANDYGGGL